MRTDNELPILNVEGRSCVYEDEALCGSPIACAVADAWALAGVQDRYWSQPAVLTVRRMIGLPMAAPELARALGALEAATRGSPLRKVKS